MYERIVVGTDGSETATKAVEAAAQVAARHAATLCVTSAYAPRLTADQRAHWQETPEKARWRLSAGSIAEGVVQEAVAHARAAAGDGLEVHGRPEPGDPVGVILQLVDELDADMVIVGNRGMTGLGRLRGSVASRVSRLAPCDVLIIDTVGAVRLRRTA
jgi:nucleotide-binding universal stress UspA family protein